MTTPQLIVATMLVTGLSAFLAGRWLIRAQPLRSVATAGGLILSVLATLVACLPGVLPAFPGESSGWDRAALFFVVLLGVVGVLCVRQWRRLKKHRRRDALHDTAPPPGERSHRIVADAISERWPALSASDAERAASDRERLSAALQERYGYERDQADAAIVAFERDLSERWSRAGSSPLEIAYR